MIAMASRKDGFESLDLVLECRRCESNGNGSKPHDRRVPERKEKPRGRRPLAFLHKFSGDVVDGRDVVRIHGVAEPERVGQKGGSQLQRIIPESD
jgi:hypothetical protein